MGFNSAFKGLNFLSDENVLRTMLLEYQRTCLHCIFIYYNQLLTQCVTHTQQYIYYSYMFRHHFFRKCRCKV